MLKTWRLARGYPTRLTSYGPDKLTHFQKVFLLIIAFSILVKIPAEVSAFTRIALARFKRVVMSVNLCLILWVIIPWVNTILCIIMRTAEAIILWGKDSQESKRLLGVIPTQNDCFCKSIINKIVFTHEITNFSFPIINKSDKNASMHFERF